MCSWRGVGEKATIPREANVSSDNQSTDCATTQGLRLAVLAMRGCGCAFGRSAGDKETIVQRDAEKDSLFPRGIVGIWLAIAQSEQ